MKFVEIGNEYGKTLMLLPGTCCDYQTNFANVLDRLADKYHLICVNYDGFDGSDTIFPDMITVTEKIERYIKDNHNGRLDGALGSSLGSSFVGQLIQRRNVHLDHGIFGSPDLDQSGRMSAKLQAKLVVPLLTSFTGSKKKREKTRQKLKDFFLMSDEAADRFMECFAKFDPESIRNEYYTDLLTWLDEDIHVDGTKVHFIYANKMGEKYLKRYKKYFRDPDIREFDMQHEQWLFGGDEYAEPVLNAIDEFMNDETDGDCCHDEVADRRTLYPKKYEKKMCEWLKARYGNQQTELIWDKTLAKYRGYLKESPDYGGTKNGHAMSIYGSMLVFAMIESLPDQPQMAELQRFTQDLFMEPFVKLGKIFDLDRSRDMALIDKVFRSVAKRDNKDSTKWPCGFHTVYDGFDKVKGTTSYHFTQCPVAEFAKKHEMLKLLPLMCNCDFYGIEQIHGQLIREGTCGNSDRCDYLIVGRSNPIVSDYETLTDDKGFLVSRKKNS